MKEDLPEEWLPTRKTKGREVEESEFLARGPLRWEFRGIMDLWRELHSRRIFCWGVRVVDGGGEEEEEELVWNQLLSLSLLLVLLSSFGSSFLPEGGVGDGFDHFQVDEFLCDPIK